MCLCVMCSSSFQSLQNVLSSIGHPSFQVELETPVGLYCTPLTPFQQDDHFSDISSIESPFRTPSRLSDGLMPSQGNIEHPAGGPPVVTAEDTSLEDSKMDDSVTVTETAEPLDVDESQLTDLCQSESAQCWASVPGVPNDGRQAEPLRPQTRKLGLSSEQQEKGKSGPDEEMTEDKVKSLFEDIQLEEVEAEEMTEDQGQAVLNRVQRAELAMSSLAGWQNETSSGSLESPAQARRLTGGLPDRLDDRYGRVSGNTHEKRVVYLYIVSSQFLEVTHFLNDETCLGICPLYKDWFCVL